MSPSSSDSTRTATATIAERAAARKAISSRGGRTTDRAPGRISEGLRERYQIAAKKIQEDLKAGKITEEQARERQQALRKRLAQSAGRGGDRDTDRSRSSRESLMKEFDKNKDGKLDEAERNALRKAMSERFRNRGGDRRGGERENAVSVGVAAVKLPSAVVNAVVAVEKVASVGPWR